MDTVNTRFKKAFKSNLALMSTILKTDGDKITPETFLHAIKVCKWYYKPNTVKAIISSVQKVPNELVLQLFAELPNLYRYRENQVRKVDYRDTITSMTQMLNLYADKLIQASQGNSSRDAIKNNFLFASTSIADNTMNVECGEIVENMLRMFPNELKDETIITGFLQGHREDVTHVILENALDRLSQDVIDTKFMQMSRNTHDVYNIAYMVHNKLVSPNKILQEFIYAMSCKQETALTIMECAKDIILQQLNDGEFSFSYLNEVGIFDYNSSVMYKIWNIVTSNELSIYDKTSMLTCHIFNTENYNMLVKSMAKSLFFNFLLEIGNPENEYEADAIELFFGVSQQYGDIFDIVTIKRDEAQMLDGEEYSDLMNALITEQESCWEIFGKNNITMCFNGNEFMPIKMHQDMLWIQDDINNICTIPQQHLTYMIRSSSEEEQQHLCRSYFTDEHNFFSCVGQMGIASDGENIE